MKRDLRIINIAPLLTSRKAELGEDLLRLHAECGVTDVAFMLPLNPEGREPSNAKAEWLRTLFEEMREPLKGSGLKVGILLQSLIGHGTFTETKFQRSVNANGMSGNNICPLDADFQDYIEKAVGTVVAAKPEFLLTDDDLRLANNGAPGCFCPLHLSALKKATGREFSRESLLAALATDRALRRIWDGVKLESLLALARRVRKAIDAIDKSLTCGHCVCDTGGMELQYVKPIEKILSGGNAQFVRANTSWYLGHDTRGLSSRIYWTSAQLERLKGIPEILAESDAYPHNRYCTPAKALDSQIAFSILHGCSGLKLWITKLDEFQPSSGVAYRETLKRKIGFYRKLREISAKVEWDGPTDPLPSDTMDIPAATGNSIRSDNWETAVFSRMGIPGRVASTGDIIALSGPETKLFSDAEIKNFLSKSVLLDGLAANALCKRGFGALLGVEALTPADFKASFELMNSNPLNGIASGRRIGIEALMNSSAVKLSPKSQETVELSKIFHIPFYMSADEKAVGAGVALFENELGGRVATFAAALGFTPFMNEIRREQLYGVLGWLLRKPLPVVVATDIDIYAMHGRIEGGGELLAVFNLHMDGLEKLPLRFGGAKPSEIAELADEGRWKKLKFSEGPNDESILKVKLDSASSLVLKISRS